MASTNVEREAPQPGVVLRERRRRRLAAEIERTALELFADRGFAAVTTDEIASAVNISQRTFFRYFPSKEDLLLGDPGAQEEVLVRALQDQPPEVDPVRALHNALIYIAQQSVGDDGVLDLRLKILAQSPDALSSAFEQRRSFLQRLTPLVAERMGVDPARDMRPALIVSLSTQASYVAWWHWFRNGARGPLHELIRTALDGSAAGLTAVGAAPPMEAQPVGRGSTPKRRRSRPA
jgi:AcrR family transcriptional regulator